MKRYGVPMDELDPPVRRLVEVLNSFKGVRTISSCGGHEHPQRGQNPAGEWDVLFTVTPGRAGWRSLEFIVWLINDELTHVGGGARVFLNAMDPLLNAPRRTLYFYLEGRTEGPRGRRGKTADEVAEWLAPTSATTSWEQARIAGAAPLRDALAPQDTAAAPAAATDDAEEEHRGR